MLSEFQQEELWKNWLSAEIRSEYFADMCSRYARWHSWLVWTGLFSSAATFAAIIGNLPSDLAWVKPVMALIATALSLLSVAMQNPEKSSESADLRLKWNRLAAEYQALWGNVYADDAQAKFSQLIEREAEISKASLAIPNKPRLVEKWERHVVAQRTGAPASA